MSESQEPLVRPAADGPGNSESAAREVPKDAVVRSYHLCLDLRGALMNWTDRQMRGVFSHDDGRPMTAREAKMMLMDEIAKGRKVIPCAPCDNFDYQNGCLGHEVADRTDPTPTSAALSESSTVDETSSGEKES